jgi:hypothetical protein
VLQAVSLIKVVLAVRERFVALQLAPIVFEFPLSVQATSPVPILEIPEKPAGQVKVTDSLLPTVELAPAVHVRVSEEATEARESPKTSLKLAGRAWAIVAGIKTETVKITDKNIAFHNCKPTPDLELPPSDIKLII